MVELGRAQQDHNVGAIDLALHIAAGTSDRAIDHPHIEILVEQEWNLLANVGAATDNDHAAIVGSLARVDQQQSTTTVRAALADDAAVALASDNRLRVGLPETAAATGLTEQDQTRLQTGLDLAAFPLNDPLLARIENAGLKQGLARRGLRRVGGKATLAEQLVDRQILGHRASPT